MTLNIKDGDYVRLRDGVTLGPVEPRDGVAYCWHVCGVISWGQGGAHVPGEKHPLDIIEVLPGKPVFIDTPFEVGKTYRTRGGERRTVTEFVLRVSNGSARHLDGGIMDSGTSISDIIPGAIEDEEQVTVTMPKADYERAMELLGRAKG